jgi:hypothetical protein
MKIILSAFVIPLAVLGLVAPASAQTALPPQAVHPDCAQPPTTSAHDWFFDAVNGDDVKGDGSETKPWKTINALFNKVSGNSNAPLLSTVRAGAPVNPGDALLLKTGNYGDVTIGLSVPPNVANSEFVTIMPAIGAKPVFHSLFISNTSKWALANFEVQSLRVNTWPSMIELVNNWNNGGPTHDIAMTGLLLNSAPPEVWHTWTTPDAWDAGVRSGMNSIRMRPGGSCVAVTNSHFSAVGFGAALGADKTLFAGNEIDHFNIDGIEMMANDLIITDNRIHSVINPKSGAHTDGMQGQVGIAPPAGQTYNTYSHILIERNWVQNIADPWVQSLPALQNYLQGIDAFDSNWVDVKILNNVVITHSCHGINFQSTHDSLIANNTVLWDGLPSSNCVPVVAFGSATHQGPLSSNSTVANNVAPGLSFDASGQNLSWVSNLCVSGPGASCTFYYKENGTGKQTWNYRPGTYAGNTLVDDATKPGGAWGEFIHVDNSALTYDLRLSPNAQGHMWGTIKNAPLTNYENVLRGINPGAY